MSLRNSIFFFLAFLPQVVCGQLAEIIKKMSWEDLVGVVDDYQSKGMYAKSLPYALRMKSLAGKRYDKKEARYASILQKTAEASEAVGDWKLTKEIREELVEIHAALGDKKSLPYALAMVNLAEVEMKLGNYKTSTNICWKVKNTKIFNPLNQRYYTLQNYNHSIDRIEDSTKRRDAYREYLEAKIVLVTNLNTLSANYQKMGDQQAYELTNLAALEETTKMIRYVLNNSYDIIPEQVIVDIRKLLKVFENFENYHKSEKLYLEIMEITRGTDLYEPLALNLAQIYVKIGEFTGAKMIYSKLLKNANEQHGAESLPFAMALVDLAAFYMLVDDSSEAAKFYLKAKGIVLRLEGRESESYIKINQKLKNVYRVSQQRDE